jgi:hypothetical protein
MNMANSDYQDHDFDYQVNFARRGGKEKVPRSKRFRYARSNRPAVFHNGIHRRRNKRFSW